MTMHPFQRLLAFAIAGISLLALALTFASSATQIPIYVAIGGLVLSAAMLTTPGVGAYMRFFIVFYGLGYLVLMAIVILAGLTGLGLFKLVPPLTAFTSAAFGILAVLLNRLPLTRRVFAIADPYFETTDRGTVKIWPLPSITGSERWIAFVLLGIIIAINLAQVGISVRLSYFGRDWFNAIQEKNQPEFWRQLFQIWAPWVAVLLVSNIVEFVIVSVFKIRWREWSTKHLMARWLGDGNHYRLQFARHGVDNPDQRIQEDVWKYIQTTYSLTISMIQELSKLVSFSVILWGLSAGLKIPGTDTLVPGLLFWIALIYATIGTYLAHKIGRRLVPLNFDQERYEANFRYGLARLREFAESIALFRGEPSEQKRLGGQFDKVITNFFGIVSVQKWLSAFTQFYGASNAVIPYVVAAPFYFIGQITLGAMNQTASAFARVDAALAFFIDRYSTLADYKAVVDRLNGFDDAIETARATKAASAIQPAPARGQDLNIPVLDLALPDGRVIARIRDLAFRKGERTLLVGPSGSGKSTLFRAIAGIWPFGTGSIGLPQGASTMLLPQRPYIPIGTLRAAVSYPAAEGTHDDAAIRRALEAVRLPALLTRLDEEANWSQILSGGEQQRLAVARALLARPDWLLLDESTSALDEPLEDAIYAAIGELLPETTVISIGHRSSLIDNHDRRVEMRMGPDSLYSIEDVRSPA